MKRISLITNSSIQYYKYTVRINNDFGKENKVFFKQAFDTDLLEFILEPVFKTNIEGDDFFYNLQELKDGNYLMNNHLKGDSDLSKLIPIQGEVHELNNLREALKKFQKKWMYLPFFKNNQFNQELIYPTDWVRVYIECDSEFKQATIVLAIDTSTSIGELDKTSPALSTNNEENVFCIEDDYLLLSNFLFSTDKSVKWIKDHISDSYYGKNDELRLEQPILQYAAYYILLIKWIKNISDTPEIQLFSDDLKKIDVDLVIDIGNSTTCALLFENNDNLNFDFEKVKKLELQDYENPLLSYSEPFPMNLVFMESNFGLIREKSLQTKKFTLPSLVRIGYEGERIINNARINSVLGRELNYYNSSPKRYLWDDEVVTKEWEFYTEEINDIKTVYLNGISEQLNSDGSLTNNVFGAKSIFSRKSLMTFVFLEIVHQAFRQINSYSFREEHGNLTSPRTIKRISISCPVGMIQHEQLALREAAENACTLLNKYVDYYFENDTNREWFKMPQIIPSIKDIKRGLSELEERKDWMYDESTSCQLVFLYGLLTKKIKNNPSVINDILIPNSKLKVASIDIGAGTSDLVINEYDTVLNGSAVNIAPKPLFWDCYYTAGDDLLKELVQQIIIEGEISSENDKNCTGVVENYCRQKEINNVSERLNSFFGEDSNNISQLAKNSRKAFINQVAIPVVNYYLSNANSGNEEEVLKFEQIIGKEFKNRELIKYFEKHFEFNFLDLSFKISSKKVNTIVEAVFNSIVKQISLIINHYEVDYLLLNGKPCSLKSLENLFKKYTNVKQSNVVNLNNYWIGKWFPFSDSNGFVSDPKTIVCVGAIISLMSSKYMKIADFNLNVTQIKQSLTTNANYILSKNFNGVNVLLADKKESSDFFVNNLPFQISFSRTSNKNYPTNPLSIFTIDDTKIKESIKKRKNTIEETALIEEVNIIKNKILNNLPLKICIERDLNVSKEILKISSVESSEESFNINYFKIKLQTMENAKGYWLDNCEFILNARN